MLAESRQHVSELERLIEHARAREVGHARETTALLRANIQVGGWVGGSVCNGLLWVCLLRFLFFWGGGCRWCLSYVGVWSS
jgi:hypothetical protein